MKGFLGVSGSVIHRDPVWISKVIQKNVKRKQIVALAKSEDSNPDGRRSVDDWDSSSMERRIQRTIDGVEKYCSSLPTDTNESQGCWEAYDYFTGKMESARESCELEKSTGSMGKACINLDHWQDFVRQIENSGGAKNTVKTLRAIMKASEHDLIHLDHEQQDPEAAARAERKKGFADFFVRMDKDKDGRLNVDEFRTSMKILGDELHGPTVTTIMEALDVHGFLDLDQFLTVVEAEELKSHSELAGIMRVQMQHLHEKEHRWWSNID